MLIASRNSSESAAPYSAEVQYLESTGTQWIDTGIYGNLETQVRVTFEKTKDDHLALAGDFTLSSRAITVPCNHTNTDGLYGRFGNKYITAGLGLSNGNHTVVVSRSGYISDGVLRGAYNTTDSFTTVATLFLFKFNGLDRNQFAGRIIDCQILEGASIVRDFIPVIDLRGVPCMYDKVSGKLFYNAGSGDFTAGPRK